MRALFCDLDLHLWGRYDFMRDWIRCDICGRAVTAEDVWQRTGRELRRLVSW